MNKIGRWILLVLGVVFVTLVVLLTVKDLRPDAEVRKVEGYVPWESETLEIAAGIPVQDGGRIKPLVAFASFKMLQLHGARSMKIEGAEGEVTKLEPMAWIMDCLFRPNLAVEQPIFRVDNSEILDAVGLETDEKRDRYSYTDLEPGMARLMELAQSYQGMPQGSKLTTDQQQTLDLALNVRLFEGLIGYLGFARSGVQLPPKEGIDLQNAQVSALMSTAPLLRQTLSNAQRDGGEIPMDLQVMLTGLLDAANGSKYVVFMFPPKDGASTEWISAGDRIMNVMMQTTREPELSVADIKMLEETVQGLPEGEAAFRTKLEGLVASLGERAEARGEYRSVPLEVSYYKKDWFLNALVTFLLTIPLVAAMWLSSGSKFSRWMSWGVWGLTGVGWVMLVIAITKRCIIMQRPPVGNLYDTIIFIAMAMVGFAMLIEWMTKRRVAIGMAPLVAAFLVVLARLFEVGDAKDNMDPLIAVLVSNFWLTIHVITITLGYAAGLITAMLAVAAMLLRSLKLDDKELRRSLIRAIYGCVCMTVFLSLVGTVLGGIWANYSWGRFWGWDPKENGALMIVLWNLAILHGRMGGLIRDWGLYLSAIFGAVVVGFSWWHVNFLGVGLHNYGFAADKIWALNSFYGVMAFFLVWGMIAMMVEKAGKKTSGSVKKTSEEPGGSAQEVVG